MPELKIITVKEYCSLYGYSEQAGYVYQQVRKGKLLEGMKRAFKTGGTWLIELI